MLRIALALGLVASVSAATACAAERLDIVAFGTSLTARSEWPDALASELTACAAGEVVINAVAQPGANSNWALSNIETVISLAPQVVLVEFSINDASLLHGMSGGRSRANTEAIISQLQQNLPDVRVVLMTMNPATGLGGASRPFLGDFYQIYRDVARERQVDIVDLAPLWEAHGLGSEVLPDGVHPGDEAAKAVIVPALVRLLGGALCRQ